MLIQELLARSACAEVRTKFNEVLLEDINKHFLTAVAILKARKPEEASDAKGLDFESLAKMMTSLKIISKAEYRSVLTKDDVGIDPTNYKELLGLLNQVPDSPKADLPRKAGEFFNAVSSLSKTILTKDQAMLKKLVGTPAESKAALAELALFADKLDKLVVKLKTA